MKILLTGATGFIGKALLKELQAKEEVREIVCTTNRLSLCGQKEGKALYRYVNIRIRQDCVNLFKVYKPDVIFHLAGESNPASNQWNQMWHTNVNGTLHLAAQCPEECRFILASSTNVYGSLSSIDYKFTEHSTLNPQNLYASSKIAAESIIDGLTNEGKINGASLRMCGVLGENMTHGFVKDLLFDIENPNFKDCEGSHIELYGNSPGGIKPYVYIDDVVCALLEFGLYSKAVGAFNISGQEPISKLEVANEVMQFLRKKVYIKWVPSQFKGDLDLVNINITKALEECMWKPSIRNSRDILRRILCKN